MIKHFSIALRVALFSLLLTGLMYPFLVTGLSYFLFPKRAHGSLIFNEDGKCRGSKLIGQNFESPRYFFPRPSAAGKGYDGMASSGSNLGPTSKELVKQITERFKTLEKSNSDPIPIDLITTSGSGLDPHISLEAAIWQAPRVALERNESLQRILSIIDELTESPQFYLFGNKRVNVLKLNLTLDQFLEQQEKIQ
jgi:K+-transporting ATPase ATPase C chain